MAESVAGLGSPGTPVGGVHSVQGVAGGTPVPVSITSGATSPTTSTVTAVPQSALAVTLLAANVNRKQATIYNRSVNAVLFIKLGAGASTTSFSVPLLPATAINVIGGHATLSDTEDGVYTGIITGIWAAGGVEDALVTEITP